MQAGYSESSVCTVGNFHPIVYMSFVANETAFFVSMVTCYDVSSCELEV